MTKKELAQYMENALKTKGSGIGLATCEKAVTAILDGIEAGLNRDGDVSLKGFGTFKVKHNKARKGRNPKTGEAIDIPASKGVHFKPSPVLKDAMNG